MKKAIARIGDMTIGEQVECKMPPTAILSGSPNVFVNHRAVATWEKCGFKIIATVPEAYYNHVLEKYVDAHIMYQSLK